MFDFSWSEIVVIAFFGLLLIGPEELPSVIRNFKNIIKKIKNMSNEFTSTIMDDDGISELKKEADKVNSDIRTIIDLEGNEQQTYEMPIIEKKKD